MREGIQQALSKRPGMPLAFKDWIKIDYLEVSKKVNTHSFRPKVCKTGGPQIAYTLQFSYTYSKIQIDTTCSTR